ncbi:MAG: GTP cyclohydrolase I FolE [Elusimicrobia bacterium RIFOXYA2_FULL_39_19]|nr:MAG: GTP cyclohydrolase I FolE [Elusimicrobia bacterium RIFOXYA2_FULL_39_19]
MQTNIDKERLSKAIRELLISVGENPDREGLKGTPRRVADYYEEALSGNKLKEEDVLSIYYQEEQYDEIVLLKNIPFYSICEHHLVPFYGKIHIAYIPHKKRLLGISKLARLVEMYSKRLQLQERIVKHIADAIMKHVKPIGVIVIAEAEHLCLSMRGVKKPGTIVVTSAVRGTFLKDARTRSEALSLIKN